ncbi:MAG: energy transducer TonB [Saprospiraceae bacterium]|nr:energy transducer TonB [Saprospiraceae bacterium]MCF8251582.1 energy transducer TonB [Saprospiraceae bacterium]MCF8282044.1 energy transducer TonB [Bacteroidales bacterium]MCF8313477.1 energy transducer TonB [Saprospiraceae bacterium]MCF8442218.1 energy transducer TonB [Saprospiraceae bacterium]
MYKPSKDKHFIKQPWFEGGPKAMKQFVADNLRYPQEALEQRLEGTVSVRYDINHVGSVIDAKIIGHALGAGLEEEAIRLVKSMQFKVDKPRGVKVVYHNTIQIHFKLPLATESTAQAQFNYAPTVTPTVTPAKEEKKKPSNSYSYTVNLG